MSWETVATEIRNGKIQQLCLKYRALYLEHEAAKLAGDKVRMNQIKPLLYKIKQQCPAIMPQAMVEGGRTASHIRAYLPLMIVDIDHIPQERIDAVEQRVKDDEHSLLAYRTISGRGLRVIARVEGSVDNNNFKDAWAMWPNGTRLSSPPVKRRFSMSMRLIRWHFRFPPAGR